MTAAASRRKDFEALDSRATRQGLDREFGVVGGVIVGPRPQQHLCVSGKGELGLASRGNVDLICVADAALALKPAYPTAGTQ
jgi:hypothetical protein